MWRKVHQVLLDRLGEADQVDWSRASLDSASVPAPGGGADTGPNPSDRDKSGSKHHVVVELRGIPLGVTHSAANLHDSKMLEETMGDPTHQMSLRSAAKGTGQAARRQGLLFREMPPGSAPARHHPAHRTARDPFQRAAGPAPLGSGAGLGFAESPSWAEGSP